VTETTNVRERQHGKPLGMNPESPESPGCKSRHFLGFGHEITEHEPTIQRSTVLKGRSSFGVNAFFGTNTEGVGHRQSLQTTVRHPRPFRHSRSVYGSGTDLWPSTTCSHQCTVWRHDRFILLRKALCFDPTIEKYPIWRHGAPASQVRRSPHRRARSESHANIGMRRHVRTSGQPPARLGRHAHHRDWPWALHCRKGTRPTRYVQAGPAAQGSQVTT